MAAAERIERGYLGSLLRLTLLLPHTVEAILNGGHAGMPTLPRLLQPFPTSWAEQKMLLGEASSSTTEPSQRSASPSPRYRNRMGLEGYPRRPKKRATAIRTTPAPISP